jgi:Ca2+-binding EF-hand superfamily protein
MKKYVALGLLGVFGFGVGLGSTPASAALVKKDAAKVLQKRDADGDGALSLKELQGKGKKASARIEKRFNRLDRNHDGKVSVDELKTRGKAKKTKKV